MGFTSLDISTAVFPTGTGRLDAGAIVSNTPGDYPEWVIPGFALDPAKFYEIVLTYDSYDPIDTTPYVFLSPTDATEASTGYYFLGDGAGDTTGDPQDVHIFIGPGLNDWDSFVPYGQNHLWYSGDPDLRVTAIRYRTMKLTDWTDWLDDARPVWRSRQSFPSNARYRSVSGDSGAGATVDECWAGTGSSGHEETQYSVFESVEDVSSLFTSPDPFGCLWAQSWLTCKRTGSDPTVSTGLLPEGSTPVFVEWEPSSVPDDVRLNLLTANTAYGNGYDWHMKIVSGLTPGDPAYAPGFVDGGSMAALDTLAVLTPTAANQTFTLGAATLAARGIYPTGDVQFVLAPVDQWTQAQAWSYGDPPSATSMKVSVSLEVGYHLRYKARFLVPDGFTPPDPVRRMWPRPASAEGPALGRNWPPPITEQSGGRFGPGAPV